MFLVEAFLNGMQFSIRGEPFHSLDVHAIGLHGKDSTGLDRFAVQLNSARAAGSGVAANVRASHVEIFAQEVNEKQSRLNIGFVRLSIDRYGDVMCTHLNLLSRVEPQVVTPEQCMF